MNNKLIWLLLFLILIILFFEVNNLLSIIYVKSAASNNISDNELLIEENMNLKLKIQNIKNKHLFTNRETDKLFLNKKEELENEMAKVTNLLKKCKDRDIDIENLQKDIVFFKKFLSLALYSLHNLASITDLIGWFDPPDNDKTVNNKYYYDNYEIFKEKIVEFNKKIGEKMKHYNELKVLDKFENIFNKNISLKPGAKEKQLRNIIDITINGLENISDNVQGTNNNMMYIKENIKNGVDKKLKNNIEDLFKKIVDYITEINTSFNDIKTSLEGVENNSDENVKKLKKILNINTG